MTAQVRATRLWVLALAAVLFAAPVAVAQQQQQQDGTTDIPGGTQTEPGQPDQESQATGDQDPTVTPPAEGDDVTVVDEEPQEPGFLGMSFLTWLVILLVVVAIVAILVWALGRTGPQRTVVHEERRP